ALEASDFALSISGGAATLSSATPTSISISGKAYTLGIGLSGDANGSETLTVNPVDNGIYDAAGNEASVSQSNNTVKLNKAPATISSVSSTTADGTYKAGDVIAVTTNFSEAVTVTGTPQLALKTDSGNNFRNSLSFDGTDDYAITSVNSSSFFTSNSSYTLELWYKTTSGTHSDDNVMLIGTYDRSGSGGATNGITALSIDPSNYGQPGKDKFWADDMSLSVYSTSRIDDNKWHHIAGVYDKENSKAYIFIDGVKEAEDVELGSHVDQGNTNKLRIGGIMPLISKTWYLAGSIGSARISKSMRYTSNFTPSETHENDSNTTGLWNVNEGSGTTLNDLSGNDYDFTIS
ncbi:uncharacterized protein METZ01_LOCUS263594, partial [marine metagenome]